MEVAEYIRLVFVSSTSSFKLSRGRQLKKGTGQKNLCRGDNACFETAVAGSYAYLRQG